jgi:L,D-transpeptidase ErfK/SrfK
LVGLAVPLCAQAQSLARDDLAGRLRVGALHDEPLSALARPNDVSIPSVMAANWGIDEILPQTREDILVPTAHLLPKGLRDGILINRAEYRLYYFERGSLVLTAPIGIGYPNMATPLGKTIVVRKQQYPTWYPTAEARREHPDWPAALPPGPDNPLGAFAIYLGWQSYLIHGSGNDFGIGRPFTRGCIRLFADDIEALFRQVPVGAHVEVVDQPVKLGWHGDELFLEAQPDLAQLDELRANLSFSPKPAEDLRAWIGAAAGTRAADIDWTAVTVALERRSGVPTQITSLSSHPVNLFEQNMALKGGIGAALNARQGFDAEQAAKRKRAAEELRKRHMLEDPYNI